MHDSIRSGFHWGNDYPDSSNYINRSVIRLLGSLECKSVLDAGCGNGALAHELSRMGYHVTALDSDEGAIEIARYRSNNINFVVGNFSKPFGLYDAIVSTEVVEHLYDPMEFFKFCWGSLNPGGHIVLTTPYHGYIKNLMISLNGGWDRHFTANWVGGHIKFWSYRTLTAALRSSNFEVLNFQGAGRFWPLWKSMVFVARRLPDRR